MTAKPPTPQGISRLLAKAGFERSVSSPSRIKGWRNSSPGYIVRKGYPETTVEVFRTTGSFVRDEAEQARMHSGYAEAIRAAGWTVTTDSNGHLTVTAPESTEGETR